MNSLMESVYAGIPLICLPLFGDQLRNAKIAERRNFGILLNKYTLSNETISFALSRILGNKKYNFTVLNLNFNKPS